MRLFDDGMSVDDWGEPSPRVSFLALPRPHTLGQEPSLATGGFQLSCLAMLVPLVLPQKRHARFTTPTSVLVCTSVIAVTGRPIAVLLALTVMRVFSGE